MNEIMSVDSRGECEWVSEQTTNNGMDEEVKKKIPIKMLIRIQCRMNDRVEWWMKRFNCNEMELKWLVIGQQRNEEKEGKTEKKQTIEQQTMILISWIMIYQQT